MAVEHDDLCSYDVIVAAVVEVDIVEDMTVGVVAAVVENGDGGFDDDTWIP